MCSSGFARHLYIAPRCGARRCRYHVKLKIDVLVVFRKLTIPLSVMAPVLPLCQDNVAATRQSRIGSGN